MDIESIRIAHGRNWFSFTIGLLFFSIFAFMTLAGFNTAKHLYPQNSKIVVIVSLILILAFAMLYFAVEFFYSSEGVIYDSSQNTIQFTSRRVFKRISRIFILSDYETLEILEHCQSGVFAGRTSRYRLLLQNSRSQSEEIPFDLMSDEMDRLISSIQLHNPATRILRNFSG